MAITTKPLQNFIFLWSFTVLYGRNHKERRLKQQKMGVLLNLTRTCAIHNSVINYWTLIKFQCLFHTYKSNLFLILLPELTMHANILTDSGSAIIGIRLNTVHYAARRTVIVLLYILLISFFKSTACISGWII